MFFFLSTVFLFIVFQYCIFFSKYLFQPNKKVWIEHLSSNLAQSMSYNYVWHYYCYYYSCTWVVSDIFVLLLRSDSISKLCIVYYIQFAVFFQRKQNAYVNFTFLLFLFYHATFNTIDWKINFLCLVLFCIVCIFK